MSGIPITWYLLPASTEDLPPLSAQYMYTSKAPPVEADEYERLRAALVAARAEAQAHSETCYALAFDLAQAEAKLAAVHDYAIYYMDAWEVFEAHTDGPEPLGFAAWLAQQSEVKP